MTKCSADQTGLFGCNFPVKWIIKAADIKMYSCGVHLTRVCNQMLEKGVEYMQLSSGEGMLWQEYIWLLRSAEPKK